MNNTEKSYCAQCGTELDMADRFCGECGAVVDDSFSPATQDLDQPGEMQVDTMVSKSRGSGRRKLILIIILFPVLTIVFYGFLMELGNPGFVDALAISHDGKLLASGGDNGSVMIWRLPEKSLLLEIDGTRPIRHLMFNQKGDRLAVAYSKSMTLYALAGDGVKKILTGDDDYIQTFCIDKNSVYTLNLAGELKIWNVEKNWPGIMTGDTLGKVQGDQYDNISLAAFSRNCRKLLTYHYSHKNITLYGVDEFKKPKQKILHVEGKLVGMASTPAAGPEGFSFSNDGAYIAELNDYEVLLYNSSDRRMVRKIELSSMPGDAPIVIDPDMKNIITGWGNGSIGFSDLDSGKTVDKLYHGSLWYRMIKVF
ncbi:MAG: hypothetical protein GXP13_02040 [Gammaproteobacteria bacterium]|nr:hypothetical protein [Gammaproteobacteria bacterium]